MNKIVKALKYARFSFVQAFQNKPPIFIAGCGHSGTSILLRMIGAHSSIFPIEGESGCALTECPKIFKTAVSNFNKQAAIADCWRWAEKTPKHILHFKFIRKMLPKTKFIAIVRDPRDVVASLKARFGDIEYGVKRWNRDNLALLEYQESATFPIHLVQYESLIASTEKTIGNCMDFLGEQFEDKQLRFHENKTLFYTSQMKQTNREAEQLDTHEAMRNRQINQPIFDGRGRWRKILSCDEVEYVVSKTSAIAKKFDYIF
jgi:hypothetical protein